jgi:iron complex transport system ATP-binding protein
MLTATDVWFGYDERLPVLRSVSLDVPSDAIVGVLGPNGSGKTTLLRILAGTRQAQRGSVTFDGAPLARFSRAALARRMAVVPQETQLAFDYTVGEVAMMGRYAHLGAFEIEGPADLAAIEGTLASTGTLHLKDRPFATLSGGEKQRVNFARVLSQVWEPAAGRHRVLFLDEPLTFLDISHQLAFMKKVRQTAAGSDMVVVGVVHDLNLAARFADRLLLLDGGRLIASGARDEVLTPEHIRAAFGVTPILAEIPGSDGRHLIFD